MGMNGVRQWLFQRVANVVTVLFVIVVFVTIFSGVSYESLNGLVGAVWFKILALVALLLGCVNSILAGWQIVGDYARKFHLPDSLLMTFVVVVTIGFFAVGMMLIF